MHNHFNGLKTAALFGAIFSLLLLVGYGIGFGILQFAFLYLAMDVGMPAGLASLVLQSSAPFTVVLGAVLLGERHQRAVGIGACRPPRRRARGTRSSSRPTGCSTSATARSTR